MVLSFYISEDYYFLVFIALTLVVLIGTWFLVSNLINVALELTRPIRVIYTNNTIQVLR